MLAPEVMKKVTLLQLQVKKLLHNIFNGDHRTKQKGYGIEFNQLRDYQLGDDIRFIDWKSSSRMNKMLVKEYIHEYNKTILIAYDISASLHYGSSYLKDDIVHQIASILAFAADHCKARVGLLLFSEAVELYIPPNSGASHLSTIIKKIWEFNPQQCKTNIAGALEFLAKISKKDTLLFFISDFIDPINFQKELAIVAQRYDFVAMRCLDLLERDFSLPAYIHLVDCETKKKIIIDAKKKNAVASFLRKRIEQQTGLFRKHGIDCLDVVVNKEYIDPLIQFFARRFVK